MADVFRELGESICKGIGQTDRENENKTKDWYMQELREENERLKGKVEAYEFVIERICGNGKNEP